jgi:ribonucleoside-triphosphate reductase
MYNLEATPAEGTTYRFAREDRKRFPDILQAGTPDAPYYTNSSQLPVGFTDDPFEALERQEPLQRRYTGGTVLHLYMSERVSSGEACKQLVRRALERFRVPYVTVTPTSRSARGTGISRESTSSARSATRRSWPASARSTPTDGG